MWLLHEENQSVLPRFHVWGARKSLSELTSNKGFVGHFTVQGGAFRCCRLPCKLTGPQEDEFLEFSL